VCLACLHHNYAEQVNHLVAEDRQDLIPQVAAAYQEQALHAILAGDPAQAPPPPPPLGG
jgi:hypothetical protein